MPPITRLLIANRGEIACRIAATARRLGLVSIAVYTDVDRHARHVGLCDEAYFIGSEGQGSPYLNIDKVLAAAIASQADAVHPGFGFLSERAEFAATIEGAGLIWVGPPPQVMELLGRKDAARNLAKRLGVPVIAGVESGERLPQVPRQRARALDELAALAECVGFPLLIKAVAGGGGRGMRVVRAVEQLRDQLTIAAEEAATAFGDGTLLVEKFIENGRHIEVQIVADNHGDVIHLGERECSIQRRHQKIVEETPSPGVDPELRDRLTGAAVRLMRGAGYVSAGTVEFLLDDDTGEFFLLEVNTRLQVEHGITEQVTGLDIVALQLHIAQGQSLQLEQHDVVSSGHAIEVRICAEDPLRDFAPQSGPVEHWQPPAGTGVRVDHGLLPVDTVPVHYDAMVAKVMVHAADRASAIGRMVQALRELRLFGVVNNRTYLLQILRNSDFASGRLTTGFVERHPPKNAPCDGVDLAAAAIWRHGLGLQKRFRNNPWRPDITLLQIGDTTHAVALQAHGRNRFRYGSELFEDALLTRSPSTPHELTVTAIAHRTAPAGSGPDTEFGEITVEIGQNRHTYFVFRRSDCLYLQHSDGHQCWVTERSLLAEPQRAAPSRSGVVALGAAVVTQVLIRAGETVAADQPLVALEAMKMLSILKAPRAGVVKAVYAAVGDAVAAGATVVELELEAA
ncbi:MAG: ATP-grasp domain-containing protein [Myxococcales bacterium]|nr:ATP-grasp domain-containing protein [Myxococcales bacterium]